MLRDDPRISSKDFLYSVMRDPTIPLSFRVEAAIAILENPKCSASIKAQGPEACRNSITHYPYSSISKCGLPSEPRKDKGNN